MAPALRGAAVRSWQRRGLVRTLVVALATAAALLATRSGTFSGPDQQAAFAQSKEVLVTGAGGRTGKLVVEKLLSRGKYGVRALVRSERAKQELLRAYPSLIPDKVFVGDILQPKSLEPALAGCFALVIVTSAVPQIRIFSLMKSLLGGLIGKKLRPKFRWKGGQKPALVDWEGQKNQIDAALAARLSRIVLVGSMGGTQPDNFLNTIGEGEGDKILMWKRKAEQYLISRCAEGATSYTVVHPGGLTDVKGGERRIVVGVDDELLKRPVRSIPRMDVAEVCVQALEVQEASNTAFDVCTDAPGEGEPLKAGGLGPLLKELGKNCDYTINAPP